MPEFTEAVPKGDPRELIEFFKIEGLPRWVGGANWLLWLDREAFRREALVEEIDRILQKRRPQRRYTIDRAGRALTLEPLLRSAISRHHSPRPGFLKALASVVAWGEPHGIDVSQEDLKDPALRRAMVALDLVSGSERDPLELGARILQEWGEDLADFLVLVGLPSRLSAGTRAALKVVVDRLPVDAWNARSSILSSLSQNIERDAVGLSDEKVWRSCGLPEGILSLLPPDEDGQNA
jgi:hypothetical protein